MIHALIAVTVVSAAAFLLLAVFVIVKISDAKTESVEQP
jgi:hypothetical protein